MTRSRHLDPEARINGKDIFHKSEAKELTYVGMVNLLPIKQCVWLSECVHCFYQGYEDHKTEAVQLLMDHYRTEHQAVSGVEQL